MADRCVLNFALREGRVVCVEAVLLGSECNCVCPNPACGEKLIAKNRDFHGRKVRKHFAHQSKTNCPGARESALHRLAKQIISEGKRVAAPLVPLFDTGEKRWREF